MNNRGGTLVIILAIVLVVIVIGIVGWFALSISVQNTIVARDQNVQKLYGDVEAVLQRRYNLIPNVVETAKDYMQFEKDLLENVTKFRSAWASATTPEQTFEASANLEQSMTQFIITMEAYPDLKSNQIVQDLITELEGSENRISTERRRYNDAVRSYNTYIKAFPGNMFATNMGYFEADYFEANPAAYTAPSVNLYD